MSFSPRRGETAIRVENLGKAYRIVRFQDRPDTLKEVVTEGVRRAFRRIGGRPWAGPRAQEEVWALREVTFEVPRGVVAGIVGGNGAGKSTLLKILSRITEPTTGYAQIHGRVRSLLEVGTGFHPELTGRDNIALNGAILGMSRAQIRSSFDAIVAFAGVERFIDTPVKRYSSGMYLRLAFAVGAHLQADILIVDEVLAVGDAEFQSKCLGKMSEVASEGRTVLFTSHNMKAIQRLCDRCLLLKAGRLVDYDATESIVRRYMLTGTAAALPLEWINVEHVARTGTGQARFQGVQYTSHNTAAACEPYPDGALEFRFVIDADVPQSVGSLTVTIRDHHGTRLVSADSLATRRSIQLNGGKNTVRLTIRALHLLPGEYVVGLWLADTVGEVMDSLEAAFTMRVVDVASSGAGLGPDGVVTCDIDVEESE
jgi:lipopolysaccharide transport system ATP-binding protein